MIAPDPKAGAAVAKMISNKKLYMIKQKFSLYYVLPYVDSLRLLPRCRRWFTQACTHNKSDQRTTDNDLIY